MIAVSFAIAGEPITCVMTVIRVDDSVTREDDHHHVVHSQVVAMDERQRGIIEALVNADDGLHTPFRSHTR